MKKIVIDAAFNTAENQAFANAFKDVAEVVVFENHTKFATPKSREAFFPAVEARIKQIAEYWKIKESKEEVIFGSIQKGFTKADNNWWYTAIVGIQKDERFYAVFAEHFLVSHLSDEIMDKQEDVCYAEMEKFYPGLKSHGLLSRLTRSQTDVEWFQNSLLQLKKTLSL